MNFKKARDSVRREALYNNLTELDLPTKLVKQVQTYLNET